MRIGGPQPCIGGAPSAKYSEEILLLIDNQDYDFNEDIACVIRVSVDLAREMLGSGTLLTQENFFPDESIDQGYNILLQRQIDSRLKTKFNKVIPKDMITDFGPRLT